MPAHPDRAVIPAVAGGMEEDDAQLGIVETVLGLAIVAKFLAKGLVRPGVGVRIVDVDSESLRLVVDQGVEGTALVVIYSNPSLPQRSIAVLEGGLSGPATQTARLVLADAVGDSTANPADPFDSTDISDDELYDLAPFLTDGDTEIVLETANPSDDDSIFVAVITHTLRLRLENRVRASTHTTTEPSRIFESGAHLFLPF
jgi:hypothetical protein